MCRPREEPGQAYGLQAGGVGLGCACPAAPRPLEGASCVRGGTVRPRAGGCPQARPRQRGAATVWRPVGPQAGQGGLEAGRGMAKGGWVPDSAGFQPGRDVR